MKDIQPDLQAPRVQIVPILPVHIPATNPKQDYLASRHTTPYQSVPFTGIPQEPFSSTGGLPPSGTSYQTGQRDFHNGVAAPGSLSAMNPLYIPAYYLEYATPKLQRKEPGLGETLLGCGLLMLIGIVGIAVLYFLSASAM